MMLHCQSRPGRFRPVLTMVLVLMVLFLVWLGLEVFFALTAKANPTVDYGAKMMEHAAAWQGGNEADDVWSSVIELVDLHQGLIGGLSDDESGTAFADYQWGYDVITDYDELLEELVSDEFLVTNEYESEEHAVASLDACRALAIESLASWEHSGIIARLDRIASGTRAVRPLPDTTQTMMINILLPELSKLRTIAKGLRAQMVLSRENEDWATYARAFEHAMAIGRIETYQITLIDRLVGIAIRALVVGQVREDLLGGSLPVEALVMLDDAMQRQSKLAPMSYPFEAERAMGLDMAQWLHDSRGRLMLSEVSVVEGFNTAGRHPIVNVASIAYPRKRATEKWFNEFYDSLGSWVDSPFYVRRTAAYPARDMEMEIADNWRYPIQKMLVPAFGRAVSANDQGMLEERGLRTYMAIERFRMDTGGLPTELGELVPEYLAQPPIDPYGDGVSVLKYKILDQPDEFGRSYLLYSVGYDNSDNDGLPSEEASEALRKAGEGTDFVINQSRD